jgi:hypothetical protein
VKSSNKELRAVFHRILTVIGEIMFIVSKEPIYPLVDGVIIIENGQKRRE